MLARQWLLERHDATIPQALEHLVGLQAQNTLPPYLALWSRLKAFAADDLSALIREHAALRLATLRGTIHLHTAKDALGVRPLLQPMIEHQFHTGTPFSRKLGEIDSAKLAADARKLLPTTTRAAGKALANGRDAEALGIAIRTFLPLVQLPPRGIWGEGGQPVCDTLDAVTGKKPRAAKLDAFILRYLAAYGPASPRDFTAWSGMRGVTFDSLKKELVAVQTEDGAALFDLPDAPRPDEGEEAPIRFLGEFDNVALAHADRARIVSEADRRRALSAETPARCLVLVDGFVKATWRQENGRVIVEPFAPLTPKERRGLEADLPALEAFLTR